MDKRSLAYATGIVLLLVGAYISAFYTYTAASRIAGPLIIAIGAIYAFIIRVKYNKKDDQS